MFLRRVLALEREKSLKFSLVMPTLNRPDDVRRFVAALDLQTFRDFELIVVDQNTTDVLTTILAPYQDRFPIRHLHIGKPIGAVAARNLGAKQMQGEILAFPDDDCWYDPDHLQRVRQLLADHREWDGLTTNVHGQEFYYAKRAGPVSRYKVWWQGPEFTLFFRKSLVDAIGPMDATLGPGAKTPWGAGEAADWLMTAVERGHHIQYLPDLRVHHPGPVNNPRSDAAEARCVYGYSMGKGHVCHKHHMPFWYVLYLAARPLASLVKNLIKLKPSKAAISLAVCKGVIWGYFLSIKLAEMAHDGEPVTNSVV
jgi:glycosyltransferase involved in cell wall biosynthesis